METRGSMSRNGSTITKQKALALRNSCLRDLELLTAPLQKLDDIACLERVKQKALLTRVEAIGFGTSGTAMKICELAEVGMKGIQVKLDQGDKLNMEDVVKTVLESRSANVQQLATVMEEMRTAIVELRMCLLRRFDLAIDLDAVASS